MAREQLTVFITGAANGIGKATTELLLEQGHEVIAYDIDENRLQELPAAVTVYHGDVYDTERVQEVVPEESFDVLVNCAGYQELGAVEDMPLDTVEEHFETNVFGLIQVTRTALPMLRERNGRIINISSLAGKVTGPFWGAYGASKHAVESVSDALRNEMAPEQVDVVVVEPGAIRTGFNERGREMLRRYLPDSHYADRYREKLAEEPPGAAPEAAAKVIVKAIEADQPKARYTVTWQAWIAPKLKWLLPTSWWDRIMRRNA